MKNIVKPLSEIEVKEDFRIPTGIEELDILLNGGFPKGAAVLVAGEPGSGKSTLVLQMASLVGSKGYKVLYGCGEESLSQIRNRADRLSAAKPTIICSESINLEDLYRADMEANADFIVIDSLQMLYSNSLKQQPSSPTQMRFCLASLIDYVKEKDKILIVIGQSTKSGLIAGMLSLQHMVDVVWYLTADVNTTRTLHVHKNRFGSAQTGWEMRMGPNGFIELEENSSKGKGIIDKTLSAAENSTPFTDLLKREDFIGVSLQVAIGIISLLIWTVTAFMMISTQVFKVLNTLFSIVNGGKK